jgi:hypothetical protein
MRRALVLPFLLALVLATVPAGAEPEAPPEEPEAPERVIDEVTLHLHGGEEVGEVEVEPGGAFRTMDRNAPDSDEPKSVFVTNYVVGPNTDCDGNGLLPTWQDFRLRGDVAGDVTVSIPAIGLPASQVVVSLYNTGGGTCSFMETTAPRPVAQATVTAPVGPGDLEVVFEDADFQLRGLILMLHVPNRAPGQTRVFYDSADMDATITFDCLAPVGKDVCA